MNEAELLFTGILNCSRTDLYLNKNLKLNSAQVSFIAGALKRRLSGEPLEYILAKAEFMGLEFRLNKNVFIPRPETEILVETVLRLVQSSEFRVQSSILDLGTGSGCIAISLAKFLPGAKVTALDISDKALEIAKENALLNKVKVKFFKMDFTKLRTLNTEQFDIIVSNPPYIPSKEIDSLQAEVRHEPRIALDGREDGLDFYRRIIKEAPRYLKNKGYLIMEMGFGQKDDIKDMICDSATMEIKEIIKDYSGIDRIMVAQKRGKKWIN
jgi:release factor glutamine methyltransferase